MTEGTKYHPLFEYLLFSGQGEIPMTFKEIEHVLGKSLPPSARQREEWWSNSPRGHSQARAWMRANYRASRVDLANETVAFTLEGWPDGYSKVQWPPRRWGGSPTGFGESAQPEYATSTPSQGREHPLFGVWEGKVTLLPGVDYTEPAFDADAAP